MKTFGLAASSVILWWVAALALLLLPSIGQVGPPGDWMVAIPVVLIFGSAYALPMAGYLAILDLLARLASFPKNLIMFSGGIAVWVGGVLALAPSSNNPGSLREAAMGALLASAPGAVLFLLRQLSIRGESRRIVA